MNWSVRAMHTTSGANATPCRLGLFEFSIEKEIRSFPRTTAPQRCAWHPRPHDVIRSARTRRGAAEAPRLGCGRQAALDDIKLLYRTLFPPGTADAVRIRRRTTLTPIAHACVSC